MREVWEARQKRIPFGHKYRCVVKLTSVTWGLGPTSDCAGKAPGPHDGISELGVTQRRRMEADAMKKNSLLEALPSSASPAATVTA
jgi:hypothetical protein